MVLYVSLALIRGIERACHVDAPPPEIATIRFEKAPITCIAPQYAAEDLLHAEGFTDVQYIASDTGTGTQKIAREELDWGLNFTPSVD